MQMYEQINVDAKIVMGLHVVCPYGEDYTLHIGTEYLLIKIKNQR